MKGRVTTAAAAAAIAAFVGTLAIAEEKTDGRPVPKADPGRTTGYVVPTAPGGNPGGQAGMNHTSRDGNTNVGGYVSGDTGGNHEGGVRFERRF
jgi:hypothetical protein